MPENQSDGKCAFGQRWWGWRFRLLSTSELPRGFDWKIGSRIQQRCTHARIQRQRVCLGYNVTVAGGNQSVVYRPRLRSEEHTSELQSLMRISYAVLCLKKKKKQKKTQAIDFKNKNERKKLIKNKQVKHNHIRKFTKSHKQKHE